MKLSASILFFLITINSFSQDTLPYKKDTIVAVTNMPNKKRVQLLGIANISVITGSMLALYNTWYKDYPSSPFHFFNDNNEWLQMDKVGHLWSAYQISRLTTESFKWAGFRNKKSYWLGAASGTAYMSIIEIFDAFSTQWGFSWGDYLANIAGSSTYLLQQLKWNEQRIQIKFSTHLNDYGNYGLNTRADSLFGKNLFTRILKDYNAQTYWASVNIKSFFKQSKWPAWLNIAIGHGASGMFAGSSNTVKDNYGNIIFNRSDIPRYRQWYLAPDIDFTKIKTHSKFLKDVFFLLNAFKFPSPALELSQGKLQWNWLVF